MIFGAEFSHAAGDAELRVAAPIRKAILCALCERNDEATGATGTGVPEPDAELRDTGAGTFSRGCGVVFGARGEAPRSPRLDCHDASGAQNGEVGLLGWESNLKRYPSTSTARPAPLEGNEADIQRVEKEIVAMLQEMSG